MNMYSRHYSNRLESREMKQGRGAGGGGGGGGGGSGGIEISHGSYLHFQ